MKKETPTYILTANCSSILGTVDVVTRFLFERQCYITEMHTFDDSISGHFFIRAEFKNTAETALSLSQLRAQFIPQAERYAMQWQIHDAHDPLKILVMVSKFDHCLNDLLYRHRTQDMNIEIPAIISNHPDLQGLAQLHGIPYHHLPITADTKPQQEAQVSEIFEDTQADLVILARYMQVFSADMCQKLHGRAINIHHSLLPGFKGAKPYHQAYDKGVKLVGATAHFVSSDLDEGPIITQGVEPVDHTHTPDKLVAKGRDIERLTLARAIKLYSEHRVFLHDNKTVVFHEG